MIKPTPDLHLALPVYDANDALRLLRALEETIRRIWEEYGEEMRPLLESEYIKAAEEGDLDEQQTFPF